jgi:hypothetical protein
MAMASGLAFVGACQSSPSPEATIVGEITDADIQVNLTTAPWNVGVEFTNVGNTTCPLIEIVTEIPADAFPLNPDGTLDMEGTPDAPGLGPGSYFDSGAEVPPGEVYRFHEMPMDAPGAYLAGPRIFVCTGPGDYEAGRYAVVDIDPPVGSPPPP